MSKGGNKKAEKLAKRAIKTKAIKDAVESALLACDRSHMTKPADVACVIRSFLRASGLRITWAPGRGI